MKIKPLRESIRRELAHRRWVYAFLCLAVIALGLLWRSRFVTMPVFLSKYGGDALWALTVFLFFGFLKPGARPLFRALLAVAFSCLIEFSQLSHGRWLEAARGTRFGLLLFGRTFNPPDMAAYAFGIFYGLTVECLYRRRLVRVAKPAPLPVAKLPRRDKRLRRL